MLKQELIDALATNAGTPKKKAALLLDALAGVAASELAKTGSIVIPGIGKLAATKRDARTGRNPRTGESVPIPASTRVKFTAAKSFKDAVQ